ncbi:hypothetical protein ANO14919_087100 [Xylariales sp. No.14919]|nr:hypothetical protein ANO14919_087100 [Xylariales sp. No.14919]
MVTFLAYANALTLGEAIENRRSVHKLYDDVSVPDSRIEEILRHAVLYSPTPFNCQSSRTVLLVKDEHKKFWDLAREIAQATEPPALFEKVYEPQTKMFRAAYGTVSLH